VVSAYGENRIIVLYVVDSIMWGKVGDFNSQPIGGDLQDTYLGEMVQIP
jgi:hypothetical protein